MAKNPIFSFTSHNSITEVNIERGVFFFINCNVLLNFTISIIMGHGKELTDKWWVSYRVMVFNITFKHFYFHMWSQIKTLSCCGCHLGILIYMKKRNFVNDYLMSIHTYMGSISSVVSEETFIHFFHIVQCKNYILQWWPFWILNLNQT